MTVFAMVSTDASVAYTAHALRTFRDHTRLAPDDAFLLIDNDRSMGDGVVAAFAGLDVVVNDGPRSFAANANLALDRARERGQALALLNNDLVFTEGWFDPLRLGSDTVSSPVSNVQVPHEVDGHVIGPAMSLAAYERHPEHVRVVASRLAGQRGGSRTVLAFPFFCVRIPHDVLAAVGRFDESFGAAGGEDRDYAVRCWLAGARLAYALDSYVLHFQGRSTWRGGETDVQRRARVSDYLKVFEAKWGEALLRLVVLHQEDVLERHAGLQRAATRSRWAHVVEVLAADRPAAREAQRSRVRKGAEVGERPVDRGEGESGTAETKSSALEFQVSRQLAPWMMEHGISLAATSYQTGKLLFFGANQEGRLSVFERTFDRAMGLHGDGQVLYLSTLFLLWRFQNVLAAGQTADGYDRLYIPQVAYTTGDIDIHDVNVDAGGRPVFVSTLFSCLATVSDSHSFTPLWRPPFISRLAAEDRCHLNGLAMRDGRAAYVTTVSQTDIADGWRDRRRDGGAVLDVRTGEPVVAGLSMPHSPRWHRDRLWMIEAGSGHVGTVDVERGTFERLVFCPGYLRGLAFVGDYAIVASSKLRERRTFDGLELGERLAERDAEARCGLFVIDLRSGDLVHWMRIHGIIEELYDVVVLPDTRRPSAVGLRTDEIRRTLSIGPEGVLDPA